MRDFARCADVCESALERAGAIASRSDLVVCAAVCRVAHRALDDGLAVANALVQYSVEVCRRCVEALDGDEEPGLAEVALAAATAADSAATLLLVS